MRSVNLFYFSPTHTTEKIIKAVGEGLNVQDKKITDITFSRFRAASQKSVPELTIIGLPVYGGRIPALAVSRLEELRGDGSPAVVIVVYGNRAYDDALLELRQLIKSKGFSVISAAAFIGEHSFSCDKHPIAGGRPNKEDLNIAWEYGRKITHICERGSLPQKELVLPGNLFYRERKPSANLSPETDESLCIKCMQCVRVCPVHAVSERDPRDTDGSLCIRCSACIKVCPVCAREFKDPGMTNAVNWLYENCRTEKTPEIFF